MQHRAGLAPVDPGSAEAEQAELVLRDQQQVAGGDPAQEVPGGAAPVQADGEGLGAAEVRVAAPLDATLEGGELDDVVGGGPTDPEVAGR